MSIASDRSGAASACGLRGRGFREVLGGVVRVHRAQPSILIGHPPVDDIEVGSLDRLGHRSTRTLSDHDLVHRPDGRHLDGGADEEQLVRDVEQLARNGLLDDREAEVASDRHDRVARDSRQDRRRDRRCVQRVVAHDEEVLAAALAQRALRIERDRFVVAVGDALHLDQLRVGVVRRGLGEGREGVRRHPRPRADADVDTPRERVLAEVGVPFPQHDRGVHGAGQRVHAERLAAAIDERADVAGPELIGADRVEDGLLELLPTERVLHPVDLGRVDQPSHVGVETEAGRAALGVVASRAFEHAAAVVDDVRAEMNIRVGPVDQRPVHPDLAGAGKPHRETPWCGGRRWAAASGPRAEFRPEIRASLALLEFPTKRTAVGSGVQRLSAVPAEAWRRCRTCERWPQRGAGRGARRPHRRSAGCRTLGDQRFE